MCYILNIILYESLVAITSKINCLEYFIDHLPVYFSETLFPANSSFKYIYVYNNVDRFYFNKTTATLRSINNVFPYIDDIPNNQINECIHDDCQVFTYYYIINYEYILLYNT